MLTIREVALRLKVSPGRVRDLCRKRRIRGARLVGGRTWQIPDNYELELARAGRPWPREHGPMPTAEELLPLTRHEKADRLRQAGLTMLEIADQLGYGTAAGASYAVKAARRAA